MASGALAAPCIAGSSHTADTLQEELLLAASAADESWSVLVLEESLSRERVEQQRRHEAALIELSAVFSAGFAPSITRPPECGTSTALSCHCMGAIDFLPEDAAERLTDEEVEHIWQREKRTLTQHIASVHARVRRLQQRSAQ